MRDIEQSEIEAFHRDGAVLLKGVLSDDWLAKLDHCMDLAQQRADGRTAGMEDLLRIDHFPADSVRHCVTSYGSPLSPNVLALC